MSNPVHRSISLLLALHLGLTAAAIAQAPTPAKPEFAAETPIYRVLPSVGFPYGRDGVHGAKLSNVEFAQRRQAFWDELKRHGPGTIAIAKSAPVVPRNGDEDYEYRQDSDFYWLTGLHEPDSIAIFEVDAVPEGAASQPNGSVSSAGDEGAASKPAGVPRYTLVVRPRDPNAETWTGRRVGPEGAIRDFGADAAVPARRGKAQREMIESLVQRAKTLIVINNNDKDFGKVIDSAIEKAKEKSDGPRRVDGRTWIHSRRLIKTKEEIEMMRKACEVSIEGHLAAMRATRPGMNEGEIEAAAEFVFRALGGPRLGYGTIAGAGNNGCVLHYQTNDHRLGANDLMLMDASTEVGMYTADITRTWPVNGKFTPEQRAIYEIVLAAQDAGIAAAQVGRGFHEVHQAAARVVSDGLVKLGILQGKPDEVFESGRSHSFFPHGTSHWLGMDVHDVGGYGPSASVLAPGMVLTVEPGIYIPKGMKGVDEKWWGIAVRIEDDILVTENGPVNLTGRLPRDPETVEAIVREGQAALKK